jgi:hypothetical protein
VATATAAAATAATARKRRRRPGTSAVTGAIRGTENRKLYRVFLAAAFRAGDFLLLVQDNFLKLRLAIVANVFVDGHKTFSSINP